MDAVGGQPIIADLHTHSTASDGTLTPVELVTLASQRGISLLALTDHDSTSGVQAAAAEARALGVRLITGIELSTAVSRGELHMLGYGIDPDEERLKAELTSLRESRRNRAVQMLDNLEQIGIVLDRGQILTSTSAESIGRPHIARAMIERGIVSSVGEAFDRYLKRGRPGWAPRKTLEAEDAIALVREAGGLPVLAHPFSVPDLDQRLPQLVEAGLGGLEAYYGEYNDEQRQQLVELASQYDLIVTGGSDYHGPDFREGRELGTVPIPSTVLDRFLLAIDHMS